MGLPVGNQQSDAQAQDEHLQTAVPFSAAEATNTLDAEISQESLEERAQQALQCPCVAELRDGPCGKQFSEAFVCYFKSKELEKGSDCVKSFFAMQDCLSVNEKLFLKSDWDIDASKENEDKQLPSVKRI